MSGQRFLGKIGTPLTIKPLIIAIIAVLMTACSVPQKTTPTQTPPTTASLPNESGDYRIILLNDKTKVQDDELDELESVGESLDSLHRQATPLNAISPHTLQNFVATIDAVRTQYVGEVSDEALFGYAMSGMLKKVDNYGEYLDKTALENLKAFTEGSVASVGIVANYSLTTGHWVVDYVIPSSPADKADIRIGDYLHEIAGIRLNDTHTNQDIIQLLSGIAGTQIDVVSSHAGRNKRNTTLQRTIAQNEGLSVSIKDGIAIVHLPVFTARTKNELVSALIGLDEPIFGVVLDVRNNPGGVLSSAIDVAGLFVADKPAVQVVGKDPKSAKILHTAKHAPLHELPVLVLQNRYSASAAEVLSATFLANNKMVAGETSYGKGSVQSVISLDNGEAIKLTTAHYQQANGNKIDGVGIVPTLSLSGDNIVWLDQAIAELTKQRPVQGVKFTPQDSPKTD